MAKIGKLFLDFEAGTAKFNAPIRKAQKQLSTFGRVTVSASKKFKGLNAGFGMLAIKAAALGMALRLVGCGFLRWLVSMRTRRFKRLDLHSILLRLGGWILPQLPIRSRISWVKWGWSSQRPNAR